jgi:hypothetical protein
MIELVDRNIRASIASDLGVGCRGDTLITVLLDVSKEMRKWPDVYDIRKINNDGA